MLGRRGFLGGLFALPFIGMIKPKSDPRIFWAKRVAKFANYPVKLKTGISIIKPKLHELYVSPEVMEDIKNWGREPEYYI